MGFRRWHCFLLARAGQSLPPVVSLASAYDQMRAVGDSASGTKSRGNVDRFGKFLLGYARL